MDFKTYVEMKRKEEHKEIIFDICMAINNCADCHNDEIKQTKCCPMNRVELYNVTQNCFYMNFYDSKTNRELIDIAAKRGYKVDFILNKEIMKFIRG